MEVGTATPQGIFVNGKQQVIDLLAALEDSERERLLKQIQSKNPTMANELYVKSLNFAHFQNLSSQQLQLLAHDVPAKVFGISLKRSPLDVQRAILRQLDRSYAEQVFQAMQTQFNDEKKACERAQTKVKEALLRLLREKQIQHF